MNENKDKYLSVNIVKLRDPLAKLSRGWKVVYPADNYFNFFFILKFSKTFLNLYNNIYKNPAITQTY